MLLALTLAAEAPATAVPGCAIGPATIFHDKFTDLPEEIRKDVQKQGPIAEAGEPYNDTDNVVDLNLPFRRFNSAGRSNGNWFIWFSHGGLAPHDHVMGYWPLYSRADTPPTLRLVADLSGEPCAAINAFINGVISNQERAPPVTQADK